jgi:hypothetical protein
VFVHVSFPVFYRYDHLNRAIVEFAGMPEIIAQFSHTFDF